MAAEPTDNGEKTAVCLDPVCPWPKVWTVEGVEHAAAMSEAEIERLTRENADLRRLLDQAQLAYIEASNPGIDMDDVRRIRAGRNARGES
jgi:hypothetical protein